MLKIKNIDLKELIIEVVDQNVIKDFISNNCSFHERKKLLETSRRHQKDYFANWVNEADIEKVLETYGNLIFKGQPQIDEVWTVGEVSDSMWGKELEKTYNEKYKS